MGKQTFPSLHIKEAKQMFRKDNQQDDPVNHPKHYTSSEAVCSRCGTGIECIDITRHMSFNIGNAVKYLWRFQDKNGLEDLKKARFYLDDEIKQMESKTEAKGSR